MSGGKDAIVHFADVKKSDQRHPRKRTKKAATKAALIAGLQIFILSGLFHDHINWVTFGEASFQTTIFFLLQFVAVAAELQLSRTRLYKSLPPVVRWGGVMTYAALCAPFFVAPYYRGGGLSTFPFPDYGCGGIKGLW